MININKSHQFLAIGSQLVCHIIGADRHLCILVAASAVSDIDLEADYDLLSLQFSSFTFTRYNKYAPGAPKGPRSSLIYKISKIELLPAESCGSSTHSGGQRVQIRGSGIINESSQYSLLAM
jgi:hypothetical protein